MNFEIVNSKFPANPENSFRLPRNFPPLRQCPGASCETSRLGAIPDGWRTSRILLSHVPSVSAMKSFATVFHTFDQPSLPPRLLPARFAAGVASSAAGDETPALRGASPVAGAVAPVKRLASPVKSVPPQTVLDAPQTILVASKTDLDASLFILVTPQMDLVASKTILVAPQMRCLQNGLFLK